MEYRQLGRSGLKISTITMGTMTIGGGGKFAQVGDVGVADASRHVDLCLDAGYDGGRCLEAFDILEAYATDHGDLDMVFGSDEGLVAAAAGTGGPGWLSRARGWGWQRLRGYPSLRERRAALQDYLRLHERWRTA